MKDLVFIGLFRQANGRPIGKGVDRSGGEGAIEKRRPRNSTNKPLSTLSVSASLGESIGHIPRVHLKGTLHQEPRKKDLFSEKHSFLRNVYFRKKMPNFLENFRPFLSEETLYSQVLTCPQSPASAS